MSVSADDSSAVAYELALGVALTKIVGGAIHVGELMVRAPDARVHDA